MEETSICSAVASQHKMDEAKEMFKSGFHKIKSIDGLCTACVLGQRILAALSIYDRSSD